MRGEQLGAGADLTFEKLSNLDLRLAPNPATNVVLITVDGLDEKEGILTVIDATGRLIWQQSVAAQQSTFLLNVLDQTFADGMYFVTLKVADKLITKRLIVSRL